ncbi:MAG TPA: OmpA family protein [Thermoanaerobaculia bacterium]|jgi:outer membrane protein OmpA-like peptidoglycan-associated protein|nr:OmpA family protein [Thermoanaerobaculia bacterium]
MIRKAFVVILATLFVLACASSKDDPNAKAKRGAGIGAATGAVAGAVIGNQSGSNRTGAVVGAAAGAAIGAAIGHRMDQQEKELREIQGVEVTRPSEGEIAVRLTSDILFDLDSAALRPESRSTLRDLATNFQRYPDEIIDIEGHTDSSGTTEHNQVLSDRRANSVRDFLVDNGVASRNVTAVGYGETRPKATNSTPEGRQLNRRVEIHIRATQT